MKIFRMQRARSDRGAAAVEFALVVPILLLIIVGIMNFGFVLAQQISLNSAARQAARYAAVDGPTCSDVKTEGRASAETIGMGPSEVPTPVVTPCPDSPAKPCTGTLPGAEVTVTMTRVSTWVITFPPFNVIPSPTLTGRGIMRCEFSK